MAVAKRCDGAVAITMGEGRGLFTGGDTVWDNGMDWDEETEEQYKRTMDRGEYIFDPAELPLDMREELRVSREKLEDVNN